MAKLKLSKPGQAAILQALKNRELTRSSPALLTEISNLLEPQTQWPQEDAEGDLLYAFSLATWQRFLAMKPVSDTLVRATCEALNLNWHEVIEIDSSKALQEQQAEFQQAQENWVERGDVTNHLLTHLQHNSRLLLLTGLTGIGKTAISLYLGDQLSEAGWPETLILRIDPDEGLGFATFATYCFRSWQVDCPNSELQDPDKLLNQFMAALVDRPLVIQLHSFEYCLRGNETLGWNEFIDSGWEAFFRRCLEVPDFAPRLIISSQDLPGCFRDRPSCDRYHCQTITGLDRNQRLRLFHQRGICVQPESLGRPALERIGSAYEGHPLALQIIACEILAKPFSGDVLAYWEKYGKEILEIEKTAQREGIDQSGRAHKLHRYSKSLRQRVKERIETTLKRLAETSQASYLLLCHGSVFNRPVPPRFWLRSVQQLGWSRGQMVQSLELLVQRYLVDYQEETWVSERRVLKLHNLVRSVAREHLKRMESEILQEETGILPGSEWLGSKVRYREKG